MLIGDIREGVPATAIYRYSDIYIHLSEARMEKEGQDPTHWRNNNTHIFFILAVASLKKKTFRKQDNERGKK